MARAQELQLLRRGRELGKTDDEIRSAVLKFRAEQPAQQPEPAGFFGSPTGAVKQFGADISSSFRRATQEMQESRAARDRGDITSPGKLVRDVGAGAAAVSGTIGAAFGAALPQGAERFIEKSIGAAIKKVPGAVEGIQSATEFLEENPKLQAVARVGEVAVDVLTGGVGAKVGKKGTKFALEGLERVPTGEVTKASTTDIFKAIRPSITKKKNLKAVKSNVTLAADTIVKQGFKPKNLQEFSNAIGESKKAVWKEVESLLDATDSTVDLSKFAADIRKTASDPNLAVVNPQIQQKMFAFSDNLTKRGIVSVNDAESIRQILNAELSTAFGEFAVNQIEKNIKKDFLKALRTDIDSKISKIPGEASDLHRRYGALIQVGEDTLKRLIVAERASPSNIFEQFGRIAGVGEIIGGLTSFQKGVDLGRIGKGVAQTLLGARAKKIADPNEIIRKAFNKSGKKKTQSKLLQKIKRGRGQLPLIDGLSEAKLKQIIKEVQEAEAGITMDDVIKSQTQFDAANRKRIAAGLKRILENNKK